MNIENPLENSQPDEDSYDQGLKALNKVVSSPKGISGRRILVRLDNELEALEGDIMNLQWDGEEVPPELENQYNNLLKRLTEES